MLGGFGKVKGLRVFCPRIRRINANGFYGTTLIYANLNNSRTTYFPEVSVVYEYTKGSYFNRRLFKHHILAQR